ncbi:MAG: ABC transporter substrate-binding protein [Candidatus Hermodarchaeota archaeon]
MEKNTKRILAIVLIAVVGVGTGVGIWIFVAPYPWSAEDCPGAPSNIAADQIIKIGVLGGIYDIQGRGALEGAKLAAYQINDAGGIVVGGKRYYVGITAEDTDESNPNLDTTKGVAAAERIINYKQCQYLTGGFRTESLSVYLETVVAAKKLFIGTGASTDTFCQNVLDNYAKYKYFFRNMPINSSSLAFEIFNFLITYAGYLSNFAGFNITKFGILHEDLDWTEALVAALEYYLPLLGGIYLPEGAEVVAKVAYPITALQTDMDGYMATIDTNNTQILIPVISAQGGILMMNSYAANDGYGFVVIGIDVQSQLDTFWGDSSQACLYETILQSLHNTSKTPISVPFWNAYVAEYNKDPLYTAVGSFDAINLIVHAINESQSFSTNTLISEIEKINKSNTFPGAGGYAAFTPSHDIQEGYPYGYTLFVQWQTGGTKVVVPSFGSIYPPAVETGSYMLPAYPGWAFNP